MVKAHKEASKAIYAERNRSTQGVEIFIDLHGLLPDEAVKYLEDVLVSHQHSPQPVYAIVGTSHHSKGGKDKLSRAVRGFLDEWRYPYREFSATGDRNSAGGILGIDPSSFDRSILNGLENGGQRGEDGKNGVMFCPPTLAAPVPSTSTLSPPGKKEPPKGPWKKK